MKNSSDFEKILNRGRLLKGGGLEINEVNFQIDAGSDREPVEIKEYLCDADLSGGLGEDVYKRVLYFLQLFDMKYTP